MKLTERIDLILEYLEKTGQPITQKTEYQGKPIGQMLTYIKMNLNRGKISYPEEQVSRLREKGLLEPERKKAIEKARSVVEYVMENPRLWHSEVEFKKYVANIKDEKEKEKIIQTQKAIRRNYIYLNNRAREGKLDKSICEMMIQAGVGGNVFGYPEDTILFAQKTGISIRRAQTILTEVGGLNKFREDFVALMIDSNTEKHTKMEEKVREINELALAENRKLPFIQGFDISQPNYIVSDDIFTVLRDKTNPANSKQFGFFVVEQRIKDFINLQEDHRRGEAIIKGLGLFGAEKQNFTGIGLDMGGLTRSAISQKVQYMQKQIGKNVRGYQREISKSGKEKFIREFFLKNDIFSEGIELEQEEKEELVKIYEAGINEAKQEREELIKKYEITPENIARRLECGDKIELHGLGFKKKTVKALNEEGIDTLDILIDMINRFGLLEDIDGIGETVIRDIVKVLNGLMIEMPKVIGEYSQKEIEEIIEYNQNLIKQAEKGEKAVYVEQLDLKRETKVRLANAGFDNLITLINASKKDMQKVVKNRATIQELNEKGIYFYWQNKEIHEEDESIQSNKLSNIIEELIKARKALVSEEKKYIELTESEKEELRKSNKLLGDEK